MPSGKSNAASGAELNRLVEEFLATVSDWSQVKVTTFRGSSLLVHFIRCHPFQDFLSVIQDRAVCAQLSHQHDAILRFLNRVFFGGKGELDVPITPVAGDTGTISTHDLVVDGIACQFKTMNNVSDTGVVTFLRKYLPAIRRNAARVPRACRAGGWVTCGILFLPKVEKGILALLIWYWWRSRQPAFYMPPTQSWKPR